MKAVACTKYGTPDDLELLEMEKPIPGDDEVLVAVHAASVTYAKHMLVTGKPLVGRLMGSGLLKPKQSMFGAEIAGRIVAIGRNVESLSPGDEVFGDLSDCAKGGYSEFVCAPVEALARKPANLSFEEAAAVPEAGLVALQALRDAGGITEGQKVLIVGASGGIGTFAVQLAKHFVTEVTAVCGTNNLDLVRSLGADLAIDYTKEDFARTGERYDLIVATVGFRSIFDYKRALKPGGIYVATGGTMPQVFQAMLLGPLLSIL